VTDEDYNRASSMRATEIYAEITISLIQADPLDTERVPIRKSPDRPIKAMGWPQFAVSRGSIETAVVFWGLADALRIDACELIRLHIVAPLAAQRDRTPVKIGVPVRPSVESRCKPSRALRGVPWTRYKESNSAEMPRLLPICILVVVRSEQD
jgi:hypothetical protein